MGEDTFRQMTLEKACASADGWVCCVCFSLFYISSAFLLNAELLFPPFSLNKKNKKLKVKAKQLYYCFSCIQVNGWFGERIQSAA